MRNFLEEGKQRLTEQEEIRESYNEIFTTAINILETHGQLEEGFPFSFFRHQSFRHAMRSSDPEVRVQIIAEGEDLKKAREVFMIINGVGWFSVKKTGVKRQEGFKGKDFRLKGFAKLDGSPDDHIERVRGYLDAIKQVRSEISPEIH